MDIITPFTQCFHTDPPSILSPAITSPISESQYASLSALLNCTAIGDHPISWTWYKDTLEVIESDNIEIENTVMNNISLSQVSIHSLELVNGGVWQCVASNDETGSDQATQILTVNSKLIHTYTTVYMCNNAGRHLRMT